MADNFCVKITEKNLELIKRWFGTGYSFTIGAYYGMKNGCKFGNMLAQNHIDIITDSKLIILLNELDVLDKIFKIGDTVITDDNKIGTINKLDLNDNSANIKIKNLDFWHWVFYPTKRIIGKVKFNNFPNLDIPKYNINLHNIIHGDTTLHPDYDVEIVDYENDYAIVKFKNSLGSYTQLGFSAKYIHPFTAKDLRWKEAKIKYPANTKIDCLFSGESIISNKQIPNIIGDDDETWLNSTEGMTLVYDTDTWAKVIKEKTGPTLKEVNERYPKGTEFISAVPGSDFNISDGDCMDWSMYSNISDGDCMDWPVYSKDAIANRSSGILYANGKWAKIISKKETIFDSNYYTGIPIVKSQIQKSDIWYDSMTDDKWWDIAMSDAVDKIIPKIHITTNNFIYLINTVKSLI